MVSKIFQHFNFLPCFNFIRGCRVRLCIFATTTWPDIHRLLNTTVKISLSIGVRGVRATAFDEKLLQKEDVCDAIVERQSNAIDEQLLEYIDALRDSNIRGASEVGGSSQAIQAGIQGLQKYGIGPCSARWFYGSFDSFIGLERRLASLYPSLVKQSGHCRGTSSFPLHLLLPPPFGSQD